MSVGWKTRRGHGWRGPDLGVALGAERFLREIRIAAQLGPPLATHRNRAD